MPLALKGFLPLEQILSPSMLDFTSRAVLRFKSNSTSSDNKPTSETLDNLGAGIFHMRVSVVGIGHQSRRAVTKAAFVLAAASGAQKSLSKANSPLSASDPSLYLPGGCVAHHFLALDPDLLKNV